MKSSLEIILEHIQLLAENCEHYQDLGFYKDNFSIDMSPYTKQEAIYFFEELNQWQERDQINDQAWDIYCTLSYELQDLCKEYGVEIVHFDNEHDYMCFYIEECNK